MGIVVVVVALCRETLVQSSRKVQQQRACLATMTTASDSAEEKQSRVM